MATAAKVVMPVPADFEGVVREHQSGSVDQTNGDSGACGDQLRDDALMLLDATHPRCPYTG